MIRGNGGPRATRTPSLLIRSQMLYPIELWDQGNGPNKMKFKSKNSKEAKITFDTPGIYYYWCTPHKGMGMIGLVVVGNDLSNIDDIASAKAIGKSKKKLKTLLASLK